jgi:hypothetical protein
MFLLRVGTRFTPSNVAPACDKLLAAAAHGCYTGIRRSESVPLFNGLYEWLGRLRFLPPQPLSTIVSASSRRVHFAL